MKTLSQLLLVPTSAETADAILALLAAQSPALPTTSWQSGSVPQVLIAVFSDSEQDLFASRNEIAAGGYLGLATGDWLTLLASQNYLVNRADPVATRGLELFADSGGGPYTLTAGTTTVSNGSRTYVATAGGTLPLNKSVFVPVQARDAGQAGNVANGALTTLVTALAGVTVSNPVPWLTVVGTAATKSRGYVKLTNAAGGSTGVGTVSANDGAGHTYTNVDAVTLVAGVQTEILFEAAAVGTAYNVGNGLITTVAADGTLPGATTCTNTPSVNVTSWITRSGSDEQTDASLTTECQDRFLSLGVGWTSAAIKYLVLQAPISTGEAITKTRVATSNTVAGRVDVTVATATGAPATQSVTDVQTYLTDHRSLTSAIVVAAATTHAITVTATAKVPTAYLSTAQANASVNLAGLSADTPIGGSDDAANKVQLEDLIAAIKAASYDSSGNNTNPASPTQINVTAPAADVLLASTEVPVFTVNITWTGL